MELDSESHTSMKDIVDERPLENKRQTTNQIRCRKGIHEHSENLTLESKSNVNVDSDEANTEEDEQNYFDKPHDIPKKIPEPIPQKNQYKSTIKSNQIKSISSERYERERSVFIGENSKKEREIRELPIFTQFRDKIKSIPSNIKCGFVIILICALAAVIYTVVAYYQNSKPKYLIVDGAKECDIGPLTKQFPSQDTKFWKSLQIGLDSIRKKDPPILYTFLFIYDDTQTMKKFTSQLIDATVNCFDAKNALVLSHANLSSPEIKENYGQAIDLYKPELEKNGVMFVSDINLLPASVARMFHILCDHFEPFVPRSIVFMTMEMQNTVENQPKRMLANVEKMLKETWNELSTNILDPLLSRVTDQVLLVKSEKFKFW